MDMNGNETGDSLKKFYILLPVIIGTLTFLFLLDLIIGSVNIPPDALFRIITGGEVKETWLHIFWDWRMPKAITALFAGGALALFRIINADIF
jgi:iron complex transport system permease protein